MAEVTLSTVVDLDLIKMKWREPFVSEGLNRKVFPNHPAGIYQGLRLIQNLGSPRQVEISSDADTGFHLAVYQRTTGFSLTYWDPSGTSIILDLSNAGLDSTDVVIGLEIDYTVSVDTTANWKAFPVADWDALPAARKNEIVVLGTIAVPAAATNITTAMISLDRVTMAWRNLSRGAVAWSPVVKNGDFEQAEAGSSNAWYWALTATAGAGTGTLTVETGDPSRNLKALTLANLSDGTVTYSAVQEIRVPVTPGQLYMVKFQKKNLVIADSGSLNVLVNFSDSAGSDLGSVSVSIDVTAVDAGYVEVVKTLLVPSGATALRGVAIQGTVNWSSSPTDVLRIDDLDLWLETTGEQSDLQRGDSGDKEVAGRLSIRDPEGVYADPSALMTYEQSGNQLSVNDRANSGTLGMDVNGALAAKSLSVTDNVTSIGASLLGSIANGDVARIITPASVFAGVEYTLIWEALPAGQNGARRYVDPNGIIVQTVNAKWNNTTNLWAKDINGEPAIRTILDPAIANGFRIESQEGATNSWADGAWTSVISDSNPIRELWVPAMAAWGGPNDVAGAAYVSATGSALGAWQSITTGGEKRLTFPFPLPSGDRLLTVTLFGFAGNAVGEEIQGKIFEVSGLGGNTQVSTTKISAASGIPANVGWTTSDTDFTPNGYTLLANRMYGLWARLPQTSTAGELLIFGVKITYDHPIF